jgi:hypothetical protein
MFPDNDWYGHKKILFDYCGIKKTFPIYAQLQHGWFPYYDKDTIKSSKLSNKICYLCWSKKLEIFFYKNGINIKSIGSPFLYLCKIKNKTLKKKEKVKGTILFPSHSSPEFPQHVHHEKIIEIIKKKYDPPYAVCLFYTDYKKKIENLYKKKNFKVYCCGSRINKNFLYNFYNIVLNFKTCVFTELNSALLYCMYLKKECRMHEKDETKKTLFMYNLLRTENAYKKLFIYNYLKKNKHSKNKLFEIACKELGYKEMKNQDELVKILGIKNKFTKIKAFVFSKLYDIKYGKKIRLGLKDKRYADRAKRIHFDYVVVNSQIKKFQNL